MDTQDHTDVDFDTSIGKLMIMKRPDMRLWSPTIIIE